MPNVRVATVISAWLQRVWGLPDARYFLYAHAHHRKRAGCNQTQTPEAAGAEAPKPNAGVDAAGWAAAPLAAGAPKLKPPAQ